MVHLIHKTSIYFVSITLILSLHNVSLIATALFYSVIVFFFILLFNVHLWVKIIFESPYLRGFNPSNLKSTHLQCLRKMARDPSIW